MLRCIHVSAYTGDTAVCVHPEDPRYQHLIGKEVLN